MTTLRNWLQSALARTPAPLRRLMRRSVPGPLLRYLRMQSKESAPSRKRPDKAHGRKQNIKQKARQSKAKTPPRSGQFARAIWAGFGTASAGELEAIIADGRRPAKEIAEAAWTLARWYASTGQNERALDRLRLLSIWGGQDDGKRLFLEAETLLRLTRVGEAKALIDEAIGRLGEAPELCLAAANALACDLDLPQAERDCLRLEWLNKPFLSAALMPLQLKDCRAALSLDNIAAYPTGTSSHSGGTKVSVLMPAYNAASTVATAIESILGQTWTNLELIVVDDDSTDRTWDTIQSFALRDSRVIALRHGTNRGTYAARNTALAAASGSLLTVQDADDWSHPQRLRLQAESLLQHDRLLSSIDRVRVDPQLSVSFNRDGSIVGESQSSLMTRRELVLELGGWDQSKIGADDEFYRRLLLKHRLEKNRIQPSIPLCFALVRDDSLTARPEIGVNTNQYGARREYLEAFKHWHQLEATKDLPDLLTLPLERPFPIPNICKPGPLQPVTVDMLLVSDLSFSKTVTLNVSMLRLAKSLGFDCGCFHWPRLLNAGAKVNSDIRQLLHDRIAASVVAGEAVAARLVIVSDPVLLQHLPDRLPIIRANRCLILVNDAQKAFEVKRALDNAYAAFGVSPVLAPTSADARSMLLAGGFHHDLTAIDWTPLDPRGSISSSEGTRREPGGSYSMAQFEKRIKPYLVPNTR